MYFESFLTFECRALPTRSIHRAFQWVWSVFDITLPMMKAQPEARLSVVGFLPLSYIIVPTQTNLLSLWKPFSLMLRTSQKRVGGVHNSRELCNCFPLSHPYDKALDACVSHP